jgi:hypothetical protein
MTTKPKTRKVPAANTQGRPKEGCFIDHPGLPRDQPQAEGCASQKGSPLVTTPA